MISFFNQISTMFHISEIYQIFFGQLMTILFGSMILGAMISGDFVWEGEAARISIILVLSLPLFL